MKIRGDGSDQGEEFRVIRQSLLPNEAIRFIVRDKSGFLILSDRRLVYIKKEKSDYKITTTIPLDLLIKSEWKKKDTWNIQYYETDLQDGCIRAKQKGSSVNYSICKFEVKHPPESDIESFTSVMAEFDSILMETLENSPYSDGVFSPRDYSYLQPFQKPLGEAEILHINTIFTDRPERDELNDKAKEVMGEEPYVLWSAMKYHKYDPAGYSHLFVVGKNDSVSVGGTYEDGILKNMDITRFRPEAVLYILTDWKEIEHVLKDHGGWPMLGQFIIATASLVYGETKYTKNHFSWVPPQNESIGNWFQDPANAIWIISDMVYNQQKELLRANVIHNGLINDPIVRKQRYYW